MPTCARCGGELPLAARFCPTCGRPVEPEVGPAPPPPPTPPILAGLRPPEWLTGDWPLVGLGVAVLLGLLFAVSALVGLLAAVAVDGNFAAAPCGAAVGSHLAFAAFGARVAAGCGGSHGSALAMGFLPLPWALMGGVATEVGLRFGWRRLPDDRRRRIAYAGKLAVAAGIGLGILAGMISGGHPDQVESGFASALNGGEVWFYATALIWFWGWIALRRRGLRLWRTGPGPAGPGLRGLIGGGGIPGPVREGVRVFAALALALAVVGLAFGLVVADSGARRIGLLFGFPVVGLSFGAALVDGAMGAALGGVGGHTSLFHFGLATGPEGAGAAPFWLFAALLLVPAAMAAVVWRRLEHDRPADEQAALQVGALTGAGFAGAAWLAALTGRVVVLAGVPRVFRGGWFGYAPQTIGHFGPWQAGILVAVRPNPVAVLGLALLWSLAGGLGAAFLWAHRHHTGWTIAGPAPGPGPGPAAGPPSAGPATWLLPEAGGQEAGAGEPPLEPPPDVGKP